jgi:peptidyl-prolyl cis-trans isomerase B (cyclophilin B)
VATKKQRQRELARQAHARRMQRQADRSKRAQRISVIAIVAILVVGIGIGGAALAGSFSSTPKAKPAASKPVTVSCVYTKSGVAAKKVNLPPATADTRTTYQATVVTNRGNVVINLLNSAAPCTVNSFVSLADQGFFDNSPCQRLTTVPYGDYILQCGDPTGTGKGGPGYEFANENTTGGFMSDLNSAGEATYPAGSVGMANAGAGTNGSQFFFVYKNSPFPPDYTPFGTVVSGLNIIQNVAKAGTDNSSGAGDGHPKEKVQIYSVTISKT